LSLVAHVADKVNCFERRLKERNDDE